MTIQLPEFANRDQHTANSRLIDPLWSESTIQLLADNSPSGVLLVD